MIIPHRYKDLLSYEKKAFANLALVLKDGDPHVTPLWFDFDGKYILINSAVGRVKDKVMRRTKSVALSISDPDNPYRYIQIRGKVVTITEKKAREFIDHLSMKYTGELYMGYAGETRVTYKILPKLISYMG
ncbi:MAG TPA: PPOX class F420-dependent oxidoreductase [Chloroflexi bacterium]|nr:PPOX class F420-dependent oxidoreductase [Chloroflexota bacterium]|tara:strand:- start:8309 stop:8701 length:393 start_codon:yes stop_codon:yes gene_type:complete